MHCVCGELCMMADPAQIQKPDQNGSGKNDYKDDQFIFTEQNAEQAQNRANCIENQNALALRITGIDQAVMQMPPICLKRAVARGNSA